MDLMNPVNVGQRLRFSTDGARPGDYTFGDVEAMLDSVERQKAAPGTLFEDSGLAPGEALLAHLRSTPESDWLDRVERAGLAPRFERVSHSAASDVWRMANGPKVEPFWKDYRSTFLRGLKGPDAVTTRRLRDQQVASARAFVQAAAKGKGVSEEEYLAMHFERTPEWLANYIEDPNGVQQVLTDIRADWGHAVLRRSDGGVEAFDTTPLKWAAQAKALEEPGYVPTVAGLRSGNENRDFLFLSLTRQRLEALTRAAKVGYGDTLVGTKYAPIHSDPIRAITQRYAGTGAMVRVRRDVVGATREHPLTNLKRMKSHDFTLDDDVYAENAAQNGLEVYTEKGWVPWTDYLKDGGGNVKVSLRNEPSEEYLSHLFEPDLGTPGATQTYGIDFRALSSPEEKGATNSYEGSGHGPLNRFLRGLTNEGDYDYAGSKWTDDRLIEMRDHLDALVQRGSLRERKSLYRGTTLNPKYAAELDKSVGETVRDPGFISTTDLLDTAHEFLDYGEAPTTRMLRGSSSSTTSRPAST